MNYGKVSMRWCIFLFFFCQKCFSGVLHDLVMQGKYDEIIIQSNQGAWLNERDDRGYTAFHLAIENNDLIAVTTLLGVGVNVNTCTDDGLYPIHIASIYGFKEILQTLVDHGANVNHQTDDNLWETPLHLCSSCEVWNMLINLGAHRQVFNSNNQLPMPPWSN